jgi:NAD(P)-dependent dehydrogenase (short-subunit alcohol dehydrogenase family)
MRLQDRIAIVTGGAQGIGRALALGLAIEGAHVVIGDVKQEAAEATAAEVRLLDRRSLAVRSDVSRMEDIKLLVHRAAATMGTVDILVNNAGIGSDEGFLDVTEATWQRVLDIHLRAAFFCSQFAARVMIPQGRGKIVSVSSTSAFVAGRASAPYAIAKAGIRMMTSALANELAPHGINVNAIAPGLIRTELTERSFGSEEALQRRAQEKTPLGRVGMPQDLVGGVVFLCSDEAAFVTGHTLVIDGGWLTQ